MQRRTIARTSDSHARPSCPKFSVAAIALTTAAAGSMAAHAQEPAPNAERRGVEELIVTGQPYRPASLLNETETGSRLGVSSFDLPVSVYVLAGDEVRLRGDTNIQDAVTRAVGITSQAQVGNGNTGLAARGFASVNSVNVLYDGQAISVGAGTVSFPYDPWTVDRIESLNGPSSVLFGNGAIGGVVNVVSRKPSRDAAIMSRVSSGSFDTYKAALDATGPIGERLSYRAAVSRIQSNGYVQRGESSSDTYSGQLQFDANDKLVFSLMIDYGHQKPMNYYGLPLVNGEVPEELREINFNITDAETWFKDRWTRFTADWQPRENVTVKNTAYTMTTRREWFRTDRYTYRPTTNDVLREGFSDVEHDDHQWGVLGHAVFENSFGDKRNFFSAGYDFNSIDFTHINNNPAAGSDVTDLFNTNPRYYADAALSPFYPRYHSDSTQLALFVEERLEITPRLSIIGGLRWDDAESDRFDLDLQQLTLGRYEPVSYRAGVVWSFAPETNFYAQVAKGHDFIGNLISLAPAQQVLEMPEGVQFEVGLKKVAMAGRLEWTVAGYTITKNNLPVADPTNPLLTVQIGEQSSEGIEATMALRLESGFGINLNATVLDAEYDDYLLRSGNTVISYNGNTPTSIPDSAFNAWLYWDVNPKLRVHSGIRYVSDTFANDTNTEVEAAYTVTDFGLRYQLTNQLVMDLLSRNLTDEFYTSGFRANSRTGGGQQIVGPGRLIEVSLTGRF